MFLQQTVTVLIVAFRGQRRNLFDFGRVPRKNALSGTRALPF